MKRHSSLAYGSPALGALVVGGENNDKFSLVDVGLDQSYEQVVVTASIRVFGHGATPKERAADLVTNVSALQDLLHHSGNFGFSAGGDILDTAASLAIGGGKILVTASSAVFTASMVGQALDVEGVGSFQIESIAGAVATCTPSSILPLPSAAAGLTIRVGEAIIRTNEAARTTGYRCRVGLVRSQDARDHRYRRTYSLSFRFEGPADSSLDGGGRRAAGISVTTDASGRRVAAFSGTFTGIGASDAVAQYTANVGGWVTPILTGLGSTFEKVDENISYDDEKAILRFRLIYQEVIYPESEGTFNVAGIKNASVSMARRQVALHGLPSIKAPTFVQVNYSASLDKDLVPHGSVMGFYASTIKPHLLGQINSKFGDPAIIIQEIVTPLFADSQISVFMDVQIKQDTPQLSFQKTVSYGLASQREFRQRWKSAPHKYTTFTPGPRIMAAVRVSETRLGQPVHEGAGIFSSEPEFPPGGALDEGNADQFQVPGTPPFPDEILGDGNQWILIDGNVEHSPLFRGDDVEALGRKDLVVTSMYQTTWIWGEQVIDEVIADTPEEGDTFVSFGGLLGPIEGDPGGGVRVVPDQSGGSSPQTGRLITVPRAPFQ